ncbi:MAG: hypothetical protein OEV28_14200 [Nitrospirota bacterium]|nr:hypothetical protein [Nitrospirota bacterium]
MKKSYFDIVKLTGIVAVAALMQFAPSSSHGADAAQSMTVKAEGIAVKNDERPDFKRRALEDAYSVAVAEAVTIILREEDPKKEAELREVVDERVLTKSSVYVLTYKLLSEGWMTHMDIEPPSGTASPVPGAVASVGVDAYHVRIEAGIDDVRLRKDLARLAAASGQGVINTRLAIVCTDFADYNTMSAFVSALKKVPNVKDVTYDKMVRGRIRFNAIITGDSAAVMDRIVKTLSQDYVATPAGKFALQVRPAVKRGL